MLGSPNKDKLYNERELEKICRMLVSRKAKVCADAKRALTELTKDSAALPVLIKALAVARVRLSYEGARALRIVATVLRDTNLEPARLALAGALGDDDEYVRRCATAILGYIGNKSIIPVLSEGLKSSRANEGELEEIVIALGNIGDESAIPCLMEALEKPAQWDKGKESYYEWTKRLNLRGVLALSLGKIGGKVTASFLARILETAEAAEPSSISTMYCLTFLGDTYLFPDSIRAVASPFYSPWGWFLGKPFYRHIDYSKEGSILRIMEVVGWQGCMAKALGWIGDAAAVPVLTRVMTEMTKVKLLGLLPRYPTDLRFSAAEALGNIGDKSALGVLLETAKDKQDPEVRWSAIKSLGLIGDESTIPKLTEALKDEKVLKAATNAINAINNRLMRSAQGSQNPPS